MNIIFSYIVDISTIYYTENLNLQKVLLESQLDQTSTQLNTSIDQADASGSTPSDSEQVQMLLAESSAIEFDKRIIENRVQELQGWIQDYNTVFPPATPQGAATGGKNSANSNSAVKNGAQGKQGVKKGLRKGAVLRKTAAKNNAAKKNAATKNSPFSDKSIDAQVKKLETPIKRACKLFMTQAVKNSDVCELFRLELEAQDILNFAGERPNALANVFKRVGQLQQYVLETLVPLNEQSQMLQATVGSLLTENKPKEVEKQQEQRN